MIKPGVVGNSTLGRTIKINLASPSRPPLSFILNRFFKNDDGGVEYLKSLALTSRIASPKRVVSTTQGQNMLIGIKLCENLNKNKEVMGNKNANEKLVLGECPNPPLNSYLSPYKQSI